jgi:hypothetical protein
MMKWPCCIDGCLDVASHDYCPSTTRTTRARRTLGCGIRSGSTTTAVQAASGTIGIQALQGSGREMIAPAIAAPDARGHRVDTDAHATIEPSYPDGAAHAAGTAGTGRGYLRVAGGSCHRTIRTTATADCGDMRSERRRSATSTRSSGTSGTTRADRYRHHSGHCGSGEPSSGVLATTTAVAERPLSSTGRIRATAATTGTDDLHIQELRPRWLVPVAADDKQLMIHGEGDRDPGRARVRLIPVQVSQVGQFTFVRCAVARGAVGDGQIPLHQAVLHTRASGGDEIGERQWDVRVVSRVRQDQTLVRGNSHALIIYRLSRSGAGQPVAWVTSRKIMLSRKNEVKPKAGSSK